MKFQAACKTWLRSYGYKVTDAQTYENLANNHKYSEIKANKDDIFKHFIFVETPYWFDESDFVGALPLPEIPPFKKLFSSTNPRNIVWFNNSRQFSILIPETVWQYFHFHEGIKRRIFFAEDAKFCQTLKSIWNKEKIKLCFQHKPV